MVGSKPVGMMLLGSLPNPYCGSTLAMLTGQLAAACVAISTYTTSRQTLMTVKRLTFRETVITDASVPDGPSVRMYGYVEGGSKPPVMMTVMLSTQTLSPTLPVMVLEIW